MNIDAQSVPPGRDAPDPGVAEAAAAAARAVGDAGAVAPAAAALAGWDIGAALSQCLERWNQVASGYRTRLGELARPPHAAERNADRYPEVRRI